MGYEKTNEEHVDLMPILVVDCYEIAIAYVYLVVASIGMLIQVINEHDSVVN